MRCLSLTLLTVTLLAAASAAAQGPIDGYLRGRGRGVVAASASAMSGRSFVGGDGVRYALPFRGQLLGLFGAYGLTDRLDVVASVPFVITDRDAGLQDGALLVKGRVLRAPFGKTAGARHVDVLAALGAQAPLSRYAVVAAGAIGQRAALVQPRLVTQANVPGFFASFETKKSRSTQSGVKSIASSREPMWTTLPSGTCS